MKVIECQIGLKVRVKDDFSGYHLHGEIVTLPFRGTNGIYYVNVKDPKGRVKTISICRLELKVHKMMEYCYADEA